MKFPSRDFARYLGAFVLAPIMVSAGLLLLDAAMRGWRFAPDPEGIAYLIAFGATSLPGLLIGLMFAGYLLRSFTEFGFLMELGLATLAAMIGSCVGTGLVLLVLAQSLGIHEFFPALLILPSLLGIAGGLLLALFDWPKRSTGWEV